MNTLYPAAIAWIGLVGLLNSGHAQSMDHPLDERVILSSDSVTQWSVAESSLTQSVSPATLNRSALHWHIPVDHNAGEARYPIGWPRIGISLRESEQRDWGGWNYLQLSIYSQTSREALPREPAGLALYTPDKEGAYRRILTELTKDRQAEIRIPLADVPRHHDVRLIQLHISESNYRHGDTVDLFIEDIALLRHTEPTVVGLQAESPVMFADATEIPVHFQLLGVGARQNLELVCELRRADRIEAQMNIRALRGLQRVVVPVGEVALAPGEYNLTLITSPKRNLATAPLRLVKSPWQ